MLSIDRYVQKNVAFVAVLMLLLICTACDADQQAEHRVNIGGVPQISPVIARVGQSEISEKDLEYRIGIAAAYDTVVERSAALVALVNDALEYEVAAAVGVAPSADDIASFSRYVDKRSKAPAVLAAVKQVFGTDIDAYQHIYLSPKIVNRSLRSWFSRNAAMHRKQRESIQQAWALVQGGHDFQQAAAASGLGYYTSEYSDEPDAASDTSGGHTPGGMTATFRNLLETTAVGMAVSTIAEDDHGYRIVRLLHKHQGMYKTEEIRAPKAPFAIWFSSEAEKVPVRILDDGLKQSIQSAYGGNIPWVKRL